jgi:hypothetical protein
MALFDISRTGSAGYRAAAWFSGSEKTSRVVMGSYRITRKLLIIP